MEGGKAGFVGIIKQHNDTQCLFLVLSRLQSCIHEVAHIRIIGNLNQTCCMSHDRLPLSTAEKHV